jgi:hypothetical protein
MKTFGGADGDHLKSKTVEPIECLHYSLNLPTSVVITGIDNQEVLVGVFGIGTKCPEVDRIYCSL